MKLLKEKAAKAMKAMTLGKVYALYLVIILAGLVLFAFSLIIRSLAVVIIASLLLLADIVFFFIFYRCPHCRKSLAGKGGNYCPHCGQWVSK